MLRLFPTGVQDRIPLQENDLQKRRYFMLSAAIGLFILAIVAAIFGFSGIAGAAAGLAKIAFFVFLILAVLGFFFGRTRAV